MALHHQLVGWAAGVYWRLVRPRTLGVCALVLDPDGRVVLVRQTYRRGWHLPGGGVHRFEPFHDALARELREEIGVDRFALERLLGVYQNRSEGKDDRVLVFVARVEAEAAAAAPPTASRSPSSAGSRRTPCRRPSAPPRRGASASSGPPARSSATGDGRVPC